MHTIAVVNEKGGTGKTTTTVNLSAGLGHLGKRVLLVDLDGQAASSRWLGVEEDNRLAEAMIRGGGLEPVETATQNVWLAPATGKLDSVAHDLRPTQGGQLRKILAELKSQYDFVMIDCPPSLGNRLIGNAMLAASHVVVPVEMSILALDGLKILLTTLEDVQEGFGHDIVLGGVLACRFDARTRLSHLVLAELQRALPNKVFKTVIRENVRMRECPASGQSILSFAPDSHAAEDYLSLAKEMLEHPEFWQLPASAAGTGQAGDGQGAGLPVALLRDSAAASVRAAAEKSGWRKPADQPDGDEARAQVQAMSAAPTPQPAQAPPAESNESKPTAPVPLTAAVSSLAEAEKRLVVEDGKDSAAAPAPLTPPAPAAAGAALVEAAAATPGPAPTAPAGPAPLLSKPPTAPAGPAPLLSKPLTAPTGPAPLLSKPLTAPTGPAPLLSKPLTAPAMAAAGEGKSAADLPAAPAPGGRSAWPPVAPKPLSPAAQNKTDAAAAAPASAGPLGTGPARLAASNGPTAQPGGAGPVQVAMKPPQTGPAPLLPKPLTAPATAAAAASTGGPPASAAEAPAQAPVDPAAAPPPATKPQAADNQDASDDRYPALREFLRQMEQREPSAGTEAAQVGSQEQSGRRFPGFRGLFRAKAVTR